MASNLPFDFRHGAELKDFSALYGRKLLKFCKPEHHPKNGAEFMRLGTLHAFREAEMGELSDDEEGLYRYRLSFPGKEYSTAEFQQISSFADGRMSGNDVSTPGGKFSKHIRRLTFKSTRPGFGSVLGEIDVEYSFPNCYIFCLSAANTLELPSPFKSQNEKWHLPSKKIEIFAATIADYIRNEASARRIVFYYGPDKDSCTVVEPSIHIRTSLVSYDKGIVSINPGNDISSLVSDALWNSPFSKPPQYSNELEFRILFFFSDNHRLLSVTNDPLLIPFELFDAHLEWLS